MAHLPAQTADATTLSDKVMAGYQGWFRTPGDRAGNTGWAHWFNAARPSAEKLVFDTWPDPSELTPGERCAVPGFTYPDGSPASLYSAQNPQTVLRHFQWMQTAGIDGVWLSEFCSHMPGGKSESDYPNVLRIMENVRRGAAATGRTWAFMYDFSGLGPEIVARVISDQWKKMVDAGVTSDPRYLHHGGKPVLLLWGFFANRPQSQPEHIQPLITFLESPGKYQAALVGGGDPNWRSQGTEAFRAMLMSMTAWQPWSVGRVSTDPITGYKVSNTSLWAEDQAACAAKHVLFIPVINPGTQIAGPPPASPALATVPRRNGNFLWEQFAAASKLGGINSAFIAMFDEVNEGTEIMKVTNTPPIQAPFLTYEGSTSDWYLRLVGQGGKMLKSGVPITGTIPLSPFDASSWYRITNKSSGLALGKQSGEPNSEPITQRAGPVSDAGFQWQLVYDGAGYFKLKNHADGKMLSVGDGSTASGILTTQEDTDLDGVKWHLEWDGTGCCRIKGKTDEKWLSKAEPARDNALIVVAADTNLDDVRWQIEKN